MQIAVVLAKKVFLFQILHRMQRVRGFQAFAFGRSIRLHIIEHLIAFHGPIYELIGELVDAVPWTSHFVLIGRPGVDGGRVLN